MFNVIVAFLIYWLIFFVANLSAIEVGHDQFYDEVTPYSAVKAAGGSAFLAILATWLRPSFETMFTNDLAWTVLQGMAWFLVFLFVYQFHPWHALGISLVTMVLVAGLATLGVDSMTRPKATVAPLQPKGAPPVRGSLSTPGTPAPASK
ncbi:MAG: hypothetical protein AB7I30_10370 [Isosphaeraceae bacterium]